MGIIIDAAVCQVILIGGIVLGFGGNRNLTLRFCIGNLDIIGKQILGKQPGSQYFLGIRLVKHTYRRPLGNHLRVHGIVLRNHAYRRVKVYQGVLTDVT